MGVGFITMRNVSKFELGNITDTCAVWNVLSSLVLHRAAIGAKCEFAVTRYVIYECLHKPRSTTGPHDEALKQRLVSERESGRFRQVDLSLRDLQEVAALEKRRQLGHGELASIAFARRVRIAFLSDDRSAQKLAEDVLGAERVQTTPHLLGWLVFEGRLTDGDVEQIVDQHKAMDRPLATWLRQMEREALRARLMIVDTREK